jgi:hypothetical protein
MEPKVTEMLLILPETYKKLWKEKYGDIKKIPQRAGFGSFSKTTHEIPLLKFAKIRESSGRVGELRYRNIEDIGHITLTEPFTAQKRWYKAMIAYSEAGQKNGKPVLELLYFFIDPWILIRLTDSKEDLTNADK